MCYCVLWNNCYKARDDFCGATERDLMPVQVSNFQFNKTGFFHGLNHQKCRFCVSDQPGSVHKLILCILSECIAIVLFTVQHVRVYEDIHQTTALYTIVTNCFSVPPFGLWSKPDPQYVGSIFQDTLPQTQSPFPIKVTGYNLSMQDLRHVPLPHITNTNGKPPTLCTPLVRVHILIPFTHKNVSLKPQ